MGVQRREGYLCIGMKAEGLSEEVRFKLSFDTDRGLSCNRGCEYYGVFGRVMSNKVGKVTKNLELHLVDSRDLYIVTQSVSLNVLKVFKSRVI